MKTQIGMAAVAVCSLAWAAGAQDLPVKVKGGHSLGETAEQFFAEGRENTVLSACATGNLKLLAKPARGEARKYCDEVAGARRLAISGQRSDYKSGDISELRTDTFTFEGGRLVKVELVYSAPSVESNYKGQTFDQIFAGAKQAFGPPANETTRTVQDVYGAPYTAHRELWLAPNAAILIAEQPGPGGSTTVDAFTRAEYDRSLAGDKAKPANPLE
jgi:hypothetical protein